MIMWSTARICDRNVPEIEVNKKPLPMPREVERLFLNEYPVMEQHSIMSRMPELLIKTLNVY